VSEIIPEIRGRIHADFANKLLANMNTHHKVALKCKTSDQNTVPVNVMDESETLNQDINVTKHTDNPIANDEESKGVQSLQLPAVIPLEMTNRQEMILGENPQVIILEACKARTEVHPSTFILFFY